MDLLVIGIVATAAAIVILFIIQLVILIYICRLKKTVERGLMGQLTSEIRTRRWKEVYNSTNTNGTGLTMISKGSFSNPAMDNVPLNDAETLSAKTNSFRSDGLVEAYNNGVNKNKEIRDGTYKTPRIKSSLK